MSELLKNLEKFHWKSIWAGDWTVMPCSDWGEHYVTTLKVGGKPFVRQVAFIFQDGKSSAWVTEEDLKKFHSRMVQTVGGRLSRVKEIADNLSQAAQEALDFMKKNRKKVNPKTYSHYRGVIRKYYNAHMPVKYFADTLDSKELDTFLLILQKARVGAESVFTNTILFDRAVARQVAKETKLPVKNLLDLTRDELIATWGKKEPLPKDLKTRHTFSVLVFVKNKPQLFTGRQAKEIQSILTHVDASSDITGSTAYPGKITGSVRIVLDPSKARDFRIGDVLVTRMTRPEFLPLMKKAAGFVTDAGGILSHAAITARELKKPCIIGTKIATQVFKDGDRVEVDATKGIVKKI